MLLLEVSGCWNRCQGGVVGPVRAVVRWLGRGGGLSGVVDGPAAVWGVGEAECGESGEVDRGGEEVEVGGDAEPAAHAGASAAVAAAHEVGDFTFDFGSGGAVVGLPGGIGLAGAGRGEVCFVVADGDLAAGLGVGALRAQRAGGAVGGEVGL